MKSLKIVFALFLSFMFVQCDSDSDDKALPWKAPDVDGNRYPMVYNRPLPTDVEQLRVLMFGNSYAEDCAGYVAELMAASGVSPDRYCLYVASRDGAPLDFWAGTLYGGTPIVMTRYAGNIEMVEYGTMADLLAQDWDVITFQQYSELAPDYDSYNPSLEYLTSTAQACCMNEKMCLAWLLVWRYESTYPMEPHGVDRYNAICDAAKQVIELNGVDVVIPVGTAIENARGTSLQTAHDITRDGTHLAFGKGRYIAACTLIQSIFKPAFGIDVLGNEAVHVVVDVEIQNSRYPYDDIDVTDDNRILCQRCAVAAVENKFEITVIDEE